MDWNLAQVAPFKRLRAGIDRLIQARRRCTSLRPSTSMRALAFAEPGLLGIARGEHFLGPHFIGPHFIGLYNLSERPITIALAQLPALANQHWHDLLHDAPCPDPIALDAYELQIGRSMGRTGVGMEE